MAINKVKYGNQTLIDLSTDTVSSAEHILLGKVGHLRDGTVVTGTASGGDQHGTIWQDGQGNVHLDDESGIALQSKTVTPSESQQIVEAGEGYYALDTVTVNAISSSYVGSGITRRSSSDLTVAYDTVNVPAGYYASQASKTVAAGTQGTPTLNRSEVTNNSVTITPTVINIQGYINGGRLTGNSTTVTASQLVSGTYSVTSSGTIDVTNYASISVSAGTEGTPTATKGSVYNHSVSVTPSVDNVGGYIGGNTKTGTAVTVTASELVSGTKSITENGTGIDVTNYASVDVDVPTGGYTATISRSDDKIVPYATVNSSGTQHYSNGDTFTWSDGDTINFYIGSSLDVGRVYVNSELVHASLQGGNYIYTPPSCDISLEFSRDTRTSTNNVYITYNPSKNNFIITFTKNQNDEWMPDCTYTQASTAYSDGKTVVGRTNGSEGVGFEFDNDDIYYTVSELYSGLDGTGIKQKEYYWTFGGITEQGETITYNTVFADAVPSDVASGKVFYNAQGEQTGTSTAITPTGTYSITNNGQYNIAQYASVNVNVGNAPVVSENDPVRFFDYDGTLLYSYSASAFQALTAMPANPSHSGLTSQGWNWTLADAKAQLTAMGACDIGQMYVTDDGKTMLYCHFEEGRLAPYLGLCPNGTVTIDWGDNTATSTLTGTSLTSAQRAQHTYASAGDYVITLTATSGTFGFLGTGNGSYVLQTTETNSQYISNVYTNSIRKIELGTGAVLGNYSFALCYSLKSITIPNSVTSFGTYIFYYCYSLKNIVVPNTTTTINTGFLQYCYSITNVEIPATITTLGSSYVFGHCYSLATVILPVGISSISQTAFNTCYSLSHIVIPNTVTSFGNSSFASCRSLANITIPNSVTTISTSAFSSCYCLGEIHFKGTTPPTVQNSNAFSSVPTDCKIYVPRGYLSAYTSATNYPSSATYTYVEE